MTDKNGTRLEGIGRSVRTLDWDSGMPKPATDHPDSRLPKLSQASGFRDHIRTGWGDVDRTPRVETGAVEAARRHRQRLSAMFVGQTLVIAAGRAHLRNNDAYFEFRADSDFLWLVGHGVEDAVLVLTPTGNEHDATLYITPPARPGEDGFHADSIHGELWIGPMPGTAELEAALGMRTRPLTEFAPAAGALLAGAAVVGPGAGAGLDGRPRSAELTRTLAELRRIKDAWEIEELRSAVRKTVDGFGAVRREIPQAISNGGERWLQGTFDRHARTVGQGPGYATIVGSGAHAPVLHWVRADGAIDPADMLLLDMGVENRSGYTADVSRTIPAGGRFTTAQREVCALVERAHRAGLAAVGPGRDWAEFHVASLEVIARGLDDWGLLPVSVDEAIAENGQHHRRYIVCGVGHHLGLDVHDCDGASYDAYFGTQMHAGMVLTVEPGLYFHAWDETVPPELRGLGFRNEDDVLVTEDGSENFSAALPIDAAGIEGWMDEELPQH